MYVEYLIALSIVSSLQNVLSDLTNDQIFRGQSPYLSLIDGEVVVRSQPRLLAESTKLAQFEKIPNAGIRGHNDGGTFTNVSLNGCADICTKNFLCLSFDFDTSQGEVCYISYTNRFLQKNSFQSYPSGDYYEWRGAINPPHFEPNGGVFSTSVVVIAHATTRNARIRYKVVDITAKGVRDTPSTTFSEIASGDSILLPDRPCKIFAYTKYDGIYINPQTVLMTESKVYSIKAAKYAFLLPLFNGQHFGKVVRLQLGMKGKKRPRPARFHEFSNFDSDLGIGPYPGQISYVDLSKLSSDFKGYKGGFSAFSKTVYINESLPALYNLNGKISKRFSVEAKLVREASWKLYRKVDYVVSKSVHVEKTVVSIQEEYVYLAPFYNGKSYFGTVVRILAKSFSDSKPIVDYLNLTQFHPHLKGFSCAFTDDKGYGYFVSQKNGKTYSGVVARVHLDTFDISSVSVLDLESKDRSLRGFSGSFVYNNFAYLVPNQNDHDNWGDNINHQVTSRFSGKVVRINLKDFQSYEVLDLTKTDKRLAGFSSGFTVSHYGYFVPYENSNGINSYERNSMAGIVCRVNLLDFRTVEVLDLSLIDKELKGFSGGFAVGKYAILVPYKNNYRSQSGRMNSGKAVRILSNKIFSKDSVDILDVASFVRGQIPDMPDDDLRGFSGGFASGKYGYFVPYFNGAKFSGKVCRIDVENFKSVQLLDLTQLDKSLAGFSGGFISKSGDEPDVPLFGIYKVLPGTQTPYKFTY